MLQKKIRNLLSKYFTFYLFIEKQTSYQENKHTKYITKKIKREDTTDKFTIYISN